MKMIRRMYINELLGTDFPIIQGGMANIASGEFAAAVSNSGALGTIAAGGMKSEQLEREIDICKNLTDRPFAVNLVMLSRHISELIGVVAKHGVRFVTVGAGSPHQYMELFRENGISVLPLVSSPSIARRLERSGVLAVIAEGTEAGGHIGEMTTMTLVPQTVTQVSMPVIAAGGIACGRQMLAAEVLGAAGVQIGTALLFTEECPLHPNYKEAILRANASKITVIGRRGGMPIRLIKNEMTREYHRLEQAGAGLEELENYTLGALGRAVREGDVVDGSVMAGFTVGQFNDILPVKERIDGFIREYEHARASLAMSVSSRDVQNEA